MRKAIASLAAALAVTALAAPAAGAAGRSALPISQARALTLGVARMAAATLPGREKVSVGKCRRGGTSTVICPFTLNVRGRAPVTCRASATVTRRPSGRFRIRSTRPLCSGAIAAPPVQSGPGGVPGDQLVMPTVPDGTTGLEAPPTPDGEAGPGDTGPIGTGPQA
jgi:hypothetical protein